MANTRIVTGICTFNRDTLQIMSFAVSTRNGNVVNLIYPHEVEPYKYRCFDDLYKSLLNILKQNGMRTLKFYDFGSTLYDIIFIDCNDPSTFHRYYYHETK